MKVTHYAYRTPLSMKQRNIASFERLINLSIEKNYRGDRLNDETVQGLVYCIFTWLSLSGHKCEIRGNTIELTLRGGSPYTISVLGTHTLHPSYPPAVEEDFEIQIWNLLSFMNWYDERF
jgi:hypothetical protein